MRIFLSYRREDSSAWAGRLHDTLAARFGEQNIFQDVAAIRPGEDFDDAIDRALAQADVTLVVIGPQWLAATGPGGEARLAQEGDYVRAELTAAFTHGSRVVPLLLGGARMPAAAQLPEGLEPLATRQAVELGDATWHQDVDGLVRSLQGEPPAGRRRRPRWLVPAGVAAGVLLAAGAVGLVVDDGADQDDQTDLTGCPTPAPPEWTSLELGDVAPVDVDVPGGVMRFDALDGDRTEEEPGASRIVMRVALENATSEDQYQYSSYYGLSVSGVQFLPDCFEIVAGQDPVSPGKRSDVLVGFEVPDDVRGPLVIDIETNEDGHGRIEVQTAV